jgi:hypothetical protein
MSHDEFATEGWIVLDQFVSTQHVEQLRVLSEPLLHESGKSRPGVRRVLHREPAMIGVLHATPIPTLAHDLCGGEARIVRSILFDKTPETNWAVPWHQDATIALAQRAEVAGFGPWSVKDGEHHCTPPRALLDQLVVIRIHLDACGAENGPLRVIPRSHQGGLVESAMTSRMVEQGWVVECCTGLGGVVVMRPHTVHSSPRATQPSRRRVLHLECTAAELPTGLAWGEEVALQSSRHASSPG